MSSLARHHKNKRASLTVQFTAPKEKKSQRGNPAGVSSLPPPPLYLTAGPVLFLFTLHQLHHMNSLSHQHTCCNCNLAISIKNLLESSRTTETIGFLYITLVNPCILAIPI